MEKDFYTKSIEFTLKTKGLSTYEVQELNHPFLEELPKHLYKYRKSGELGMKEFYIHKRSIYTASFDKLGENDAFEGITPATRERIIKYDAVSMCRYYKDHIIRVIRDKIPELNLNESNKIYDIILDERFDNSAICKRILTMVGEEKKKQLKRVISAITYIFKNIDDELDSNKDFRKGMEMLLNVNNIMGAFCMCVSMSNDQLWSLYADNYTGYCIEYDLSSPCKSRGSIKFISNLYPVRYVDKKDDDWFKVLYEATVKSIDINGRANRFDSGVFFNCWFVQALCTKKTSWSYEKEWRFLGESNKGSKGPLISNIIVGHNINKNDFDEIQRYAKTIQCDIKITDIDYEKQEVISRELTQDDIEKINKRI